MNAPVIQFVDGPVGQIETASLLCDLAQPMPAQALLLLHPHPLHGGTMGNKVVTTIARVARDGGCLLWLLISEVQAEALGFGIMARGNCWMRWPWHHG